MKTLNDWLADLEQRQPSKIKLGLARVTAVAKHLQLQDFSCPVVTVAGTNGKGSTIHGLTHLLQQAGLKVGAYFSPHLFKFTERIQYDLQPVTETLLCQSFAAIQACKEQSELTYFEFTTLAALHFFKNQQPDILVLEVGLGGRLDAVNVVSPDYAIITSIGLDHCEWLGHSKTAIGAEKAGIFRAKIPAMLGEQAIISSVMEKAAALDVSLCLPQQDFYWKDNLQNEWVFQGETLPRMLRSSVPESDLLAMAALWHMKQQGVLSDIRLSPLCQKPISIQLPGRFMLQQHQRIRHIYDVAHNADGVEWLAKKLAQQKINGKILAVWSSFRDKALTALISPLVGRVDNWFVGELASERGACLAALTAAMSEFDISPKVARQDIRESYQAALAEATCDDVILVFGSFETVAMLWPDA